MGAYRKCIYLPGDSFPDDERIRRVLEHRLGLTLELLEDRKPETPEARLGMLRQYVEAYPDIVFTLFGRSSGARVVTALAADPQIAPKLDAVVALSYPFRRPGWPDEPERYAHLPRVLRPCLIIQGRDDAYTGAADLSAYALSTAISVQYVPGDHGMWLEPPVWSLLGAAIGGFLGDHLLTALREARPALSRLSA